MKVLMQILQLFIFAVGVKTNKSIQIKDYRMIAYIPDEYYISKCHAFLPLLGLEQGREQGLKKEQSNYIPTNMSIYQYCKHFIIIMFILFYASLKTDLLLTV